MDWTSSERQPNEQQYNYDNLLGIISNCGGGIYVVQNNRIVFHNPQFSALLGYSSHELSSISFMDIVHSKDKKLINLLFSDNFKEISQKSSRSYTYRALHKNGELRWLKSNVSLIQWQGKPALLDNCFDITQQKEFEEKLVEEEQNFRLLVNGLEDMLFIINKRGVIMQANQSVYQHLGYQEHQINLRNFSGLLPFAERSVLRSNINSAFANQRMNLITVIRNSENWEIPVEIRFFKGNWSQKEVVFAICQDITARLEAEKAIKLSEEKFSKAFENNAVMMTISSFHDDRFIDVNETFLKTIKLDKELVIGSQTLTLNLFVDSAHYKRVRGQILELGSVDDFETLLITPQGEQIIVSCSIEPIDIQGELCLLTIMTDITQKKQNEERIMLSEQRFRQLANLLPEKVFEANAQGYVTYANQYFKQIFGYTDEHILEGLHISSLFHGSSQNTINRYLNKSVQETELPSIELTAIRLNGTTFPSLTHIISVIEKGSLNRYMGVMVDITSRKEQEMELVKAKVLAENAAKAKEQFLSTMSHEIRTPMNAVIGMTNILLQENPMEHQMEHLRALELSAQGLMALLNDILDFSKIEAGKLKVDNLPTNLFEVVQSLHHVNKHIAQSKGIELILDVDESLPAFVLTDRVRLNQILTNLVSNALKFTSKGSVTIALKQVKETPRTVSVYFAVVDTGSGIPIDKQQVIFDEFTQANLIKMNEYSGTGLGLAIAQKLVSLLKGKIELESTLGKGSKFHFTLKFTKAPAKEYKQRAKEKTTSTITLDANRPFRILIVEDNEINSYIAAKFLNNWGMVTKLAENGREALELLNKYDFDLILMDLEMPEMNGYEATKAIRSHDNLQKSQIPIIALTATAVAEVQQKVLKIGMNDVVLKPFNPNELKAKLAEHLQL